MDAAALPGAVQHIGGGGFESLVTVGGGQFDAAPGAPAERALKVDPEGPGLAAADLYAQHIGAAIGVDRGGNGGRKVDKMPASLRCIRLLIYVVPLLSLSMGFVQSALAQAGGSTPQPSNFLACPLTTSQLYDCNLVRSRMVENLKFLSEFIAYPTVPMVFSSVTIPASGRLVIQSTSGEWNLCSGVLIAPTKFLTAAHCLCEHGDGVDCGSFAAYNSERGVKKVEGYVYFPSVGKVLVSDAHVFEHYHRVSDRSQPDPKLRTLGDLGDLAVIDLADEVNLEPISLGGRKNDGYFFEAGFGRIAFQPQAPKPASVGEGTYGAGIGTIGNFTYQACQYPTVPTYSDTVCGGAYVLGGTGPNNVGACEGDSGGPLVSISPSGPMILLGIESFILDLSGGPCSPRSSFKTSYTAIDYHLDWLEKFLPGGHTDNLTSRKDTPNCGEILIISTDEMKNRGIPGANSGSVILSVIAVAASDTAPDYQIHDSFGAPVTRCERLPHMDAATSCRISTQQTIEMEFKGPGLVQVTVCQKN